MKKLFLLLGFILLFGIKFIYSQSFNTTFPCHINVNDPEYLNQPRKPVIDATFYWQGFGCTGTLINRSTSDGQLGYYFVTARHCVSEDEFDANSPPIDFDDVFYLQFNYQSPNESSESTPLSNRGETYLQTNLYNTDFLGNNLDDDDKSFEYIHTTKLRLIDRFFWGDFALLEILTPLPPHFNVSYAGWSPSPFFNGYLTGMPLPPIPSPFVGISHPKGDIKKIHGANQIDWLETPDANACYTITTTIDVLFGWLWGNSVSTQVICNYVDNPWLDMTVVNFGATEGGSSGSGIFNSANQLFGVLSGVGGTCDFPAYPFYGKLRANYYNSSIKNTMNPSNDLAVDIGGLLPKKITCYENLILPGSQGPYISTSSLGQYFPASHYQDENKIILQASNSIEVTSPITIYPEAEYKFRAPSIVYNNIMVKPGGTFIAEIGGCETGWKTSPEEEMENLLLAELKQIKLPERLKYNPPKQSKEQIQVYPNPNNGIFTLQCSSEVSKEIIVQNILGYTVYESNNNTANTIEIDLRNLAVGVYVVKVITESGNIYTEKVVYK